MKKAQMGKGVPKGMVESEMFPGKMIPKSKSNYENKNISKMLSKPKAKAKAVMPKKKAKSGGSFPDLNKDGKITKADILKGRGVINKMGGKTKKAQMGDSVMTENKMLDKLRPSEVARMRGPQGKVDSVGRAKAIKEGMFKEKGGDFFPTSKYMAAKKVGKTSINKMGGKTKSMMHGKGAMKMGGKKSKK